MKKAILLTGATGFLGSHLMVSLLEQGENIIILGRSASGKSLDARMKDILAWFGYEHYYKRIECHEARLLEPLCGLDHSKYRDICEKTKMIIHCASDTRFSECHKNEITGSNIDSLHEVLKMAANCRGAWFHYISTAYVSGTAEGICFERLPDGSNYSNIYEETKAAAEKLISASCSSAGIPFTIIRPSVVYGHSVTGRSNNFNALYFHVKSLYYIREIYMNDLLKNKGRKSVLSGISFNGQGILKMPIRIWVRNDGLINLISVDYFVSAVLAVISAPEEGRIYHITSRTSKKFSELARWCEAYLKISGLQICKDEEKDPTPAEAMLNTFIAPYLPYVADSRTFDRSNLDAVFPAEEQGISYPVFEKCMDYAVSVRWKHEF